MTSPSTPVGNPGTDFPSSSGVAEHLETPLIQTFPQGLAHSSQSQRPNFYLWLGRRETGPLSKRKIRPDAMHKRFSTLFLTPKVPSNSPEVVKGHWKGKHG